MGALVAFEVARALHEYGAPSPDCVFVAAMPAPHLKPRCGAIHELADDAFVRALSASMPDLAILLESPALLRRIVPLVRSEFAAVAAYRHRSSFELECPVIALSGARDPWATREDVEAWASYTRGPFQFCSVDGDHHFVRSHEGEVLSLIRKALDAEWRIACAAG
jgi:surfactin synthase thioesterase subunit